ncbi:MAG: hypothetical protein ACI4OZ_02110 [Akkermansia sp.]
MQKKGTEMRMVATALLMSAAAAWGSAAEAGRDGQSVRKETAAVELRIREMAAEKWTRASFGRREQDLCMEPLPRREGDPAGLRRYLLTAEGQPPCLLLVVVDEQTGEPQSMQLQDTAATTEELVRNKYASVLRDAQTGRTLAVRGSLTQEQLRAWGSGDFVPHVGTGGGALTPTGPLFGPVWFMPVGVSKSYVSPLPALPAAAPSAPVNSPLHLLGGARPAEDEQEAAQQPAEEEESQEPASVAVAASSSSAAAGGSFGASGGGAGSGRSAARMSLRLLGSSASGTAESPAVTTPARQYSWDFTNKCPIYSSDGGATWTAMNWQSWTEQTHDVYNKWDTTPTDATKVTISENTTFKATYSPNKITGVGENINVAIMGSTLSEHYNPCETLLENIDTLYIGSTTTDAGSNGWRIRLGISDFIKDSSKVIYNDGGQLWIFSHASDTSGRGTVEVGATIYAGGTRYDDQKSEYTKRGLAADIRLEGFVNLKNTIHLTDHARIIALKDTNLTSNGEVHFLKGSSIVGHGNDLELGAIDTSVRASIPYYFDEGSEISGVRGLVLGGEQLGDGSKYGKVNVYMSGKLDAGSLSVGNGSALHLAEAAGALRFHNVGPGSTGRYLYSLLLEDNGESKALVNMGDKATISCAGDNLVAGQTSGLPVGVISGELALQVQGDKVTISGGSTATAIEAGSKEAAWKDTSGQHSTSSLRNLAVDLKAGASLELNDMVLSSYHALRGTDANEVRLNNVVVDLTTEYTMEAQDPAQKPSVLYSTGNAPGEGKTLAVLDTDKVLVLDYTGMSNLHFAADGTLMLDFAGLDLSGYNYVAVDFGGSVDINPEMVTVTGNTGHSDPAGYFVVGDTHTVYFHLAPEPASAALCLFGLAALAARRRRSPQDSEQ